eukprot:7780857-Pyramimonas_sp.AAC.1
MELKYVGTKEQIADMMTEHFEPKKADLWRDLLEHSLILRAAPLQCAPKNQWKPLRGPRRPD